MKLPIINRKKSRDREKKISKSTQQTACSGGTKNGDKTALQSSIIALKYLCKVLPPLFSAVCGIYDIHGKANFIALISILFSSLARSLAFFLDRNFRSARKSCWLRAGIFYDFQTHDILLRINKIMAERESGEKVEWWPLAE
jgi:hypothetical protein